ncbi:FAD-binding oxidoreductase [Alkalihalobacillus trypoxylicola]|uniref:FAD-linked oxidase n=1 Tax=Alkalihalobacillus trypoxylicola TaxID=519424 RepID=A0A162DT18_9BACI|nr:FAD-binding oxidoreductase [Alkalihalobacillus trypoxylicola]KYG30759.1 FAD-linked oxidase [Alkalihalobacillus trypoxylicola]
MESFIIERFMKVVGSASILTEEKNVLKLSRDYYWYSPVLKEELEKKKADIILIPETTIELKSILNLARDSKIPVTIRGAGTGNYGQAMPLTGGIVIDLSHLNEVIEWHNHSVKVQAGMRLRDLEKQANEHGLELTIYPSTFAKATIGGFVAGGSGGIGSVTWGNLWDGNVLEATVLTMNEPVQLLTISGDDLLNYIHSYGTTGVIIDVTIPLKPKRNWRQIAFQFSSLTNVLTFTEDVASSQKWNKRLVTVLEAPISTYFLPLKKKLSQTGHYAFLEIEEDSYLEIKYLAESLDGEEEYTVEPSHYRKGIGISDFTWNHTTLWALKNDDNWTYLQNFFNLENYQNQISTIKKEFGEEVLIHIEWLKDKGKLIPAGLPLVKYSSKERLYQIIEFFNQLGASVNDPHTYLLGAGGWNLQLEAMAKLKKVNDPYDLLNQGKMPSTKAISVM